MSLADNTEDLYRQDSENERYTIEQERKYVEFAIKNGDSVRREHPGVLQIRILKPKPDKKGKTE